MATRKKGKTKKNRFLRNAERCETAAGRPRSDPRIGGEQRKRAYLTMEEAEEALASVTKGSVLQLEKWEIYQCRHSDEPHYHVGRADKARPEELKRAEIERIEEALRKGRPRKGT